MKSDTSSKGELSNDVFGSRMENRQTARELGK